MAHAHPRVTLCVVAKAPVAGFVKTRLAQHVGDVQAVALARAFLQDTLKSLSRIAGARIVIALDGPAEALPETARDIERWEQGSGGLGARLERILHRGLEDGAPTLVLGADSPGLPPENVEAAIHALTSFDAVLGPAEDGGFYLLGLRPSPRLPHAFLEGVTWSAPSTLVETQTRLRAHGLVCTEVAPWFDIDTKEDLQRLKERLRTHASDAPYTAATLAELVEAGRERLI